MGDKSDFSRKSVSFNVTDPIDKKILDHIESKPFTKYVKALILADIENNNLGESVLGDVDKMANEESMLDKATTNDILNAINNIADILQSKVIGDIVSGSIDKKDNDSSDEIKLGVKNADKFKQFENFNGI